MDNWQSWSPEKNWLIKIPTRNYCPVRQVVKVTEKPKGFKLARDITGWCSWYGYGRNISEKIILDEVKAIKEKNIEAEYILIDDGWCEWGQWLKPDKNKFPGGMKKIASDLKNSGFKPGLWIAPFLVENNWGLSKRHILDFGKEEVQIFIFQCLDKILGEWKFELIKLDFLYAPFFLKNLETDKKPTEYLREVFEYIRKKYPKVYIMACGCPFEAAKYLVDSIRISDDVAVAKLRNWRAINRWVSKQQIGTLIKKWERYQDLKQYFNLDPDVMITDQGIRNEKWMKLWKESKVRFLGNRFAELG